MAKTAKKVTRKAAKKAAQTETIAIIGGMAPQPKGRSGRAVSIASGRGAELRAFGFLNTTKEIDFAKFLERWHAVSGQVRTMINDLSKESFGKMALSEVEVSIGVSGEGTIGIATAKAEASVVLKFTAPTASQGAG